VQVKAEEGQAMADDLGLDFVQASATSFVESSKPFHSVARVIYDAYHEHIGRADAAFA
jgi:hypothetical protein